MRKNKDIAGHEGYKLPSIPSADTEGLSLKGKFLVSMPTLIVDRFHKSVIYLCRHDSNGAMGIMINRDYGRITFNELLGQIDPQNVALNTSLAKDTEFQEGLGFDKGNDSHSQNTVLGETIQKHKANSEQSIRVHYGGPVEIVRGFVLHTNDFQSSDSEDVGNQLILTSTIDILRSIATGEGPSQSLFALGYAGWGPYQLEEEIKSNGWLVIEGRPEIILQTDLKARWDAALASIGINPLMLSNFAGSA